MVSPAWSTRLARTRFPSMPIGKSVRSRSVSRGLTASATSPRSSLIVQLGVTVPYSNAGSQTSSISTSPSMPVTVRTSTCSVSSSAGGRVCGVTASGPWDGPTTSASFTTAQPLGVRQVVVITFVPGS